MSISITFIFSIHNCSNRTYQRTYSPSSSLNSVRKHIREHSADGSEHKYARIDAQCIHANVYLWCDALRLFGSRVVHSGAHVVRCATTSKTNTKIVTPGARTCGARGCGGVAVPPPPAGWRLAISNKHSFARRWVGLVHKSAQRCARANVATAELNCASEVGRRPATAEARLCARQSQQSRNTRTL